MCLCRYAGKNLSDNISFRNFNFNMKINFSVWWDDLRIYSIIIKIESYKTLIKTKLNLFSITLVVILQHNLKDDKTHYKLL